MADDPYTDVEVSILQLLRYTESSDAIDNFWMYTLQLNSRAQKEVDGIKFVDEFVAKSIEALDARILTLEPSSEHMKKLFEVYQWCLTALMYTRGREYHDKHPPFLRLKLHHKLFEGVVKEAYDILEVLGNNLPVKVRVELIGVLVTAAIGERCVHNRELSIVVKRVETAKQALSELANHEKQLVYDTVIEISLFAKYVVEEIIDIGLVTKVCKLTLDLYEQHCSRGELFELCRSICYLISTKQKKESWFSGNTLQVVLESIPRRDCAVGTADWELLDCLSYCATLCQELDTESCEIAATSLEKLSHQGTQATSVFIKHYSSTMMLNNLLIKSSDHQQIRISTGLANNIRYFEENEAELTRLTIVDDAASSAIGYLNLWAFSLMPLVDLLAKADSFDPFEKQEIVLASLCKFFANPSHKELVDSKRKNKEKCPTYIVRNLLRIIDVLLKQINGDDDSSLKIAKTLLKRTSSRSLPASYGSNCIQCNSYEANQKNSHLLAMAYCLRVLRNQEEHPNTEMVIQDVESAIDRWLTLICNHDEGCPIMGDAMFMLCNIVDLSTIKGSTKLNSKIYRLLITFAEWRNLPNQRWLSFLVGSRRLSHALCISPVDKAFLIEICNSDKGSESGNINFWLDHLQDNMTTPYDIAIAAVFKLKLSYSHDGDIKINDAIEVVNEAIDSDGTSAFTKANLCYDLSEILLSAGRLLEAIFYAEKGFQLRLKLFLNIYTKKGPLKKRYESVAIKLWSTSLAPEDMHLMTSYKVLQCYLESTLQMAILCEMLGDAKKAMSYLSKGKDISNYHALPVFIVEFCSLLGKLYRETLSLGESEEQLRIAKEILSGDKDSVSCSNCRLMLEVSVNGDPDVDRLKKLDTEMNIGKGGSGSQQKYSPEAKLKHTEYGGEKRKRQGSPDKHDQKRPTHHPCVCTTLPCSYCFFVESTKSGQLSSYLKMRWEFGFRKLRIGLFHEQDAESFHTVFCGDRKSNGKWDVSAIRQLIRTDFYRNTFAIQIVEVLYEECLKALSENSSRDRSCQFELADAVELLFEAYVLCREVPTLLKKVSSLLSIVYTIFNSKEHMISVPLCGEDLSQSHWALYFHQASLGSNLNHQFFRNKTARERRTEKKTSRERPTEKKTSREQYLSSATIPEDDYLMRVASKSVTQLEAFVTGFFSALDRDATIFGLSTITGRLGVILQKWILCDKNVQGASDDAILPKFTKLVEKLKKLYVSGVIRREQPYIDQMVSIDREFQYFLSNLQKELFGDSNTQHVVELLQQLQNNTKPTILVLDYQLSMLPWENIPILESKEVYRLPTVGSISWISQNTTFSSIDPFRAFIVVNPDGDLLYDESLFKSLIHDFKIPGIVRSAPTIEQFAKAVEKHDVFIYCGHGNSRQYFPRKRIKRLQRCGAMMLIGCSNGVLKLDGEYIPCCAPFDYLQIGSPAVFSTMWSVTEELTLPFMKIYEGWRKERDNKVTVGSFLVEYRNNCKYRYAMGAVVVCYGIPTRLVAKEVEQGSSEEV